MIFSLFISFSRSGLIKVKMMTKTDDYLKYPANNYFVHLWPCSDKLLVIKGSNVQNSGRVTINDI